MENITCVVVYHRNPIKTLGLWQNNFLKINIKGKPGKVRK